MCFNQRYYSVLAALILATGLSVADAADDLRQSTMIRRPVAIVLDDDQSTLFVANRRSGTVSVLDIETQAVTSETAVGKGLSDLVATSDGRFLATDERGHQLVVLRKGDKHTIHVAERAEVSPYPVSVVVSDSAQWCSVASLWSRRLTLVDIGPTAESKRQAPRVIDLPFPPRAQLLVKNDTRLIVADAFDGRLGIVDVVTGKLILEQTFPAHNIRGMRLSNDNQMLIVSHQMLNEFAHTVQNDVHWGLLMANDLRWLKLDAVLSADSNFYGGGYMHPLGQPGEGSGDPSRFAVTASGTTVTTISGTNQIAFGDHGDGSFARIEVGRRPTDVVVTADGKTCFVANTFDDTVSVVQFAAGKQAALISLGGRPPPSVVEQGEYLFYNATLSHDSWMSCHSCHPDGHANAQLNDNFSDRSFGAPKRVLSLLGVADTGPYAWTATSETIEEQIGKSTQSTMQGNKLSETQVEALAAYLRTLVPPPSVDRLRGTLNQAAIERGRAVFDSQNCVKCHKRPFYTSPKTYDVGLVDKEDNRRFNPPSLRGVGQRGPYFHDGSIKTLPSVFRDAKHRIRKDLTSNQIDDLVSYLRSLE